jgi:hypothetical protein
MTGITLVSLLGLVYLGSEALRGVWKWAKR